MKCYICTKENMVNDAVAVCAVCGMGLCMDHVIERDVSSARHIPEWGSKVAMLILCQRCAEGHKTDA